MTLKPGGTQPLFTIYDLRFTAFMRQPRRTTAEGGERLRAGAELDVEVERILPGGVGLAHARPRRVGAGRSGLRLDQGNPSARPRARRAALNQPRPLRRM